MDNIQTSAFGEWTANTVVADAAQVSSYVDQLTHQFTTEQLSAKQLMQGVSVSAEGEGSIATGYKSTAEADFSQAHGHQAMAKNAYSYVWNGDGTARYIGHEIGTFSINPANGAAGVYVGDKDLKQVISEEAFDSLATTLRAWED